MITKRNRSAVAQHARTHGLESNIERALTTLEAILPVLGPQSHSRPMINRIGCILLQDTVTVIAPSCPDYSHINGKYTFMSVGTGLPLLSQLHITFLDRLATKLPHATYELVVADQEAADAALCARIGLNEDEFLERIHGSIRATSEYLTERGWSVSPMTVRFPDLQRLEREVAEEMTHDERLHNRIKADTIARSDMYRRLGVGNIEEMRQRTIRTASQYGALAQIAAREQILVCNHETVNLSWYNRYGAAVLHNPISVY